MRKGKSIRLAAFVGALCASAALVAAAAGSTGAYFTASEPGTLTATAGHIQVSTTGTELNFENLLPGVDKSLNVTYTPSSNSGNEDIWMVFDATTAQYGAFTGSGSATYGALTGGGLGGYGHFKIFSDQGLGFESYNLALPSAYSNGVYPSGGYSSTNPQGTCLVNGNGDGGSTARAVGPVNATQSAPECGVPAAIKIGSNIPASQTHTATVTFGLTGKASGGQGTQWADVPFKIVATQVGISPTALNY